jgi:hypothetical protein
MIEDGRAGPTMSLPSATHVSLHSGIGLGQEAVFASPGRPLAGNNG